MLLFNIMFMCLGLWLCGCVGVEFCVFVLYGFMGLCVCLCVCVFMCLFVWVASLRVCGVFLCLRAHLFAVPVFSVGLWLIVCVWIYEFAPVRV